MLFQFFLSCLPKEQNNKINFLRQTNSSRNIEISAQFYKKQSFIREPFLPSSFSSLGLHVHRPSVAFKKYNWTIVSHSLFQTLSTIHSYTHIEYKMRKRGTLELWGLMVRLHTAALLAGEDWRGVLMWKWRKRLGAASLIGLLMRW